MPVSLRLFRSGRRVASPETPEPALPGAAESARCVESFLNRQDVYKEVRTRRREILKKWQEEECPFTPAIDPHSDRLACGRRPLGATWDSLHQTKPLKQAPQQLNPEHTFSPEINPYSELLAGYKISAPVFERLYRHGIATQKNQPAPSRSSSSTNNSSADAANYQPAAPRATPKQYSHIRSRYNMARPESVLQVAAQREHLRERRRQQREHEVLQKEMEECTFQPNVGGERKPMVAANKLPNGLDKFLKHRKAARGKSEDRKKLEESYVSLRSSACPSPKRPFELTVPAPFSFL